FCAPLVLLCRAPTPVAVLLSPVVLLKSARTPLAVLLKPVVFRASAIWPIAVLLPPMMTFGSEMFGVAPPDDTRGADAVTCVTPPDALRQATVPSAFTTA